MTMLADWLETLGASALYALWLPFLAWTVVALAGISVLRLWRAAPTLAQYAVRVALLLALPLGLVLAALTDLSFLALLASPSAEAPGGLAFALPLLDAVPTANVSTVSWNLSHGVALLTLLAASLAFVRLAGLARHAWALRRFRKRLPATTAPVAQPVLDSLAASLGLWRPVRAVVTAEAVAPMTLGWRRPLVVVPAALLNHADRLRLALLHELIHIRHRDALVQSVEQVIGALFAINPAVWVLQRSIGTYREMVCDAEVIAQPRVSSKGYAALLYSFVASPPFHRQLAPSMASSEKNLKKRILAMKTFHTPARRVRGSKLITLLLAGLLMGSASLIVACTDLADANIEASDEIPRLTEVEAEALHQEAATSVDEMPQIIGGLQAIQKEIKYPQIARLAGIEGRVLIDFIVDEQGRPLAPKVVEGVGGGCDEEAVRALETIRFKPGKVDGKAVKVKLTIPITFKLPAEVDTDPGE